MVLESRSGSEPSWGHRCLAGGAQIGMLQIQVLCPCCVLATPACLQRGEVRATLAPFNIFSDRIGKTACFSNLFVLCEEIALLRDALRHRGQEAWHKLPSLCAESCTCGWHGCCDLNPLHGQGDRTDMLMGVFKLLWYLRATHH